MDKSPLIAALDRLRAARDDVQLEVAKLAAENQRLRRIEAAAAAYLATTEGRAVTFREGLTRAELAAAVEGKP